MKSFVLSACICSTLLSSVPAFAQMSPGNPHVPGAVGCDDSPTPGSYLPTEIAPSLRTRTSTPCPPAP
jgi:hypothetical protein